MLPPARVPRASRTSCKRWKVYGAKDDTEDQNEADDAPDENGDRTDDDLFVSTTAETSRLALAFHRPSRERERMDDEKR